MILRKTPAALAGWMCLLLLSACSEHAETPNPETTETVPESVPESATAQPDVPDESRVIYWLSDYDICPAGQQERSAALAMFEDQYGGSIRWIRCDAGKRQEALSNCLLSGDPVDMVAFEKTDFPAGILQKQFAPLDDYLDLTDAVWDDMRSAIDSFSWQGQHYIIPYAVTDPLLLLYSRETMAAHDLPDPCSLYQNGEWNWEVCLEMMQTFTESGAGRYGVAGQFGRGLLQSTGMPVILADNDTGSCVSQLASPEIAEAEAFLQRVRDGQLYDSGWYDTIPAHVLFYAMQDWALDTSNAANPDADYMAVPFPAAPGQTTGFLTAEYQSELLVKQSDKGEAVAAYLLCERIAATDAGCQERAREQALEQVISPAGTLLSYRTEEQQQAIEAYLRDIPCVTDCIYGMGKAAYTEGVYDVAAMGAGNLLQEAILLDDTVTWEQLRPLCSEKIKEAILLNP